MISYHVYSNDGAGGPVDYGTVLATVSGLTWDTTALTAGTWRFGVRAFDTVSGLEESNVDAMVEITINADLEDVTAVPQPPLGLTAVATANGSCLVAWTYPRGRHDIAPEGFHIYLGSPTLTLVDSVLANGSTQYTASLAGLTDGVSYQVAVRAFSFAGLEEQNTTIARFVADATAPANVANLTAS